MTDTNLAEAKDAPDKLILDDNGVKYKLLEGAVSMKVPALIAVLCIGLFGAIWAIAEHLNRPRAAWCLAHGYTVTDLPGRSVLVGCIDGQRRLILPE